MLHNLEIIKSNFAEVVTRGIARNLFLGYKNFWGGIKLQYSCSVAILTSFLPHKKFTWTDLGVYIPIYAPVAMPLLVTESAKLDRITFSPLVDR